MKLAITTCQHFLQRRPSLLNNPSKIHVYIGIVPSSEEKVIMIQRLTLIPYAKFKSDPFTNLKAHAFRVYKDKILLVDEMTLRLETFKEIYYQIKDTCKHCPIPAYKH